MNYKGSRKNQAIYIISIILGISLILFSVVLIFVTVTKEIIKFNNQAKTIEELCEPVVVQSINGGPTKTSTNVEHFIFVEPEPELPSDWEFILCMVASEIQTGSKENQMALAQCVRNTSERDGRTFSQVLQEDYSAKPCDPSVVSGQIKDTCYRIFVLHETVIPTNVEVMYSTSGGFYSSWHEQQQFEFQIEGIKYFSYPIYNAR